jgi:hypothetical protein
MMMCEKSNLLSDNIRRFILVYLSLTMVCCASPVQREPFHTSRFKPHHSPEPEICSDEKATFFLTNGVNSLYSDEYAYLVRQQVRCERARRDAKLRDDLADSRERDNIADEQRREDERIADEQKQQSNTVWIVIGVIALVVALVVDSGHSGSSNN